MYVFKKTPTTYTYNTGGFSLYWEVAFFTNWVPDQKSETWVLIQTLVPICYVVLHFEFS